MKKNLPTSPHLQIYKPQITSLLSITHRITGFGLNLALILLSLWIISFSLGNDFYNNFVSIFETIFIKVILYFIVLGISYHALNGIRHILWDFGFLISNKAASISGLIIIFSSIVLSFFISNFIGIF
ncbi:MAG: succinate dehydrogenase, cytochrome b556 subunit [Alphaproteobacteria bacterium]|jgi:succinate dehydrogenase / fumarate reductase cytochrome b subunit|nr:succinate dehydrogenase, cytochrome b556 subunit [Alphaproteobacteria bacterium]|tara:strand:- start:140 stop:520 length:381 start_codon:yes stop_codon:yes gene_type:complete